SNNRSGNGGAIFNASALTVSGCTLSGNSALDGGGGIFNQGGIVSVADSTIAGNSAEAGGGIYNYSGIHAVTGSTLSGNSAANQGGGIFNDFYAGTLYLTNGSNVCDNSAPAGPDLYNLGFVFISSDSDVCVIGP